MPLNAASSSRGEFETRLHALLGADWHFADARTQTGVHGIHPYPAKFIPQLPRQLMSILAPEPGAVVFDPFCGSGTTLVEAQHAGHSAVGVDLNPIATLIARVKTRRSSTSAYELAHRTIQEARDAKVSIPAIPRVDHWFAKEVQRALAALAASIREVPNDGDREDLQLILSSIIVRVSFQDGDTRYAAVAKKVSEQTVYQQFERSALELDRARDSVPSILDEILPSARVITRDILSVSPHDIGPVDLVITSPPYPNAYEYWLYHKYRMYWLGLDPLAVREAEIGARPHFFKKNPHSAADFERQMGVVFSLLSRILKSDGFACFVVGDSQIHGQIVQNVSLLRSAATAHGFSLFAEWERRVPSNRKAFNPANSRTKSESIAVFVR